MVRDDNTFFCIATWMNTKGLDQGKAKKERSNTIIRGQCDRNEQGNDSGARSEDIWKFGALNN